MGMVASVSVESVTLTASSWKWNVSAGLTVPSLTYWYSLAMGTSVMSS